MALLVLMLLLPTLFPQKTGWLASLIPLPVFYYHVSFGRRKGTLLMRNGILLATGVALLFGSLPILLFSLTLVPLGISFSHGFISRKPPVSTAFVGFAVLLFCWVLYWSGLATILQENPYISLLAEIDRGLAGGLMLYEESAELNPETLESIRMVVAQLRTYIPQIFPALMISGLLSIVWLNLAFGNLLLRKRQGSLNPWPEYREWQLPQPLVWLAVVSGALFILLPAPLSMIGLNGLIVCATLYFFQGLAIAANFFHKWSVPRFFRVLIYGLIFIQTYGIIILSFLGLIDVWADFRKLDQPQSNSA
jgi:uncharacterized protein YybS (DUF2232 family)